MTFRASFCHPLKEDIIELGRVSEDAVLENFEKIPWLDLLEKLNAADMSEIHYSPSLEIENIDNKNGICVSIIDTTEWLIFYKRPKMVKKWFGLVERMNENYSTDVYVKSIVDVKKSLTALINNDLNFLENHIR